MTGIHSASPVLLPPRAGETIRTVIEGQKDRLFLWSPVVLALGIGLYFSLRFEPPMAIGLVGFAGAAALAVLAHPKREERYLRWLAAIALALILGGFSAAQLRTHLVASPILEKETGPADIAGRVVSIEELEGNGGSRILLSDLTIEDISPAQTPRYARLRLRADEGIRVGQRIAALAALNPPSPPVAPGAFDFQRYMYFQRIGGVGFIYRAPEVLEQGKASGWHQFWEQARLSIIDRIKAVMAGEKERAVAAALITGKRGMIAEEDVEAMRDSGLAHLLAISGLHVGLVAGVLFFFSRLLMAAVPGFGLRHPIKKYSAVIALIGAFFYMVLVGAPVPTQRAMLMTGVVLLAVMLDRWAISMRLVAFAALVVLLIAPESLLSASFHMSFAAVVCLVAFYEHYREQLSVMYRQAGFLRRVALYFLGVCVTTLIAGTATAPFALFHFQQYAHYGLLGNFVAVPLVAFVVMPMAVFALILMPFGLEAAPLWLMEKGIAGVLETARWVAGLPGAVMHMPVWPLLALVILVLGMLVLILWRGIGKAACVPFFILSLSLVFIYNQADILISSSYKLISFRGADGALLASARNTERFVLENWERLSGAEEGDAKGWHREGLENGLACDAQGCRTEIKGKKVAFTQEAYGLREDCAWADILLSSEPVERDCAAAVVIDRFDTWRSGAHGIWIDGEGGVTVRTVEEARGRRPWTVSNVR